MKRRGITLVEILTASVVMAVALLVLFSVNSSSNQMTLDSYFEFLGLQIAQEPIEVFRAIGYPGCTKLARFPIGKTESISAADGLYPVEASMFERTITFDASKPPLCLVTVSVSPKTNTLARVWMRKGKNSIVMKGLIPIVR